VPRTVGLEWHYGEIALGDTVIIEIKNQCHQTNSRCGPVLAVFRRENVDPMIAAPYRIPVSNSTPAAPGARVVSNTQNQAYIAAGAALIRFLMQSCGLAHTYGPNGFPADSEELLLQT